MAASVFAGSAGGCAPERPPPISSFEDTVAVQTRLNEYFYAEVVPRLHPCWRRLEGAGTVAIAHSYVRDGGARWTAETVNIEESTLDPAQQETAARCMREAVAGTSFAAEPREAGENRLVVHWVWPVPLPDEDPVLRALHLGAGGGIGNGCDGHGAPPRCQNCVDEPYGLGFNCANVCVGYHNCSVSTIHIKDDWCEVSQPCASGGPLGFVGILATQ